MSELGIVEYCDTLGRTIKFLARGHVDKKQFSDECFLIFGVSPTEVFYAYQWETTKKEKKNGKDRYYSTMEQCNSERKGEPITIGKV